MYKHARGPSPVGEACRDRPLPRSYCRQVYWPAIEHDKRGFARHYKKRAPQWLLDEVARFTPEKWIAYRGRRTGKPNRKQKPPKRSEIQTDPLPDAPITCVVSGARQGFGEMITG